MFHPIPTKRVIDVVVSVVCLVLTFPIAVVAAILIFLIDPGPVFIRQEREGLNGVPFRMLKLRTMYRNANDIFYHYLATDSGAHSEWSTYLRFQNDPRLLPMIGYLFRRTSIDELPQFWNVLVGEMSLVGPRPFALDHVASLTPALRRERTVVVPGMTGLWQVSGRSDTSLAVLQKYDVFYVRKHSLRFDLWILFKTIPAVIRGKGAY